MFEVTAEPSAFIPIKDALEAAGIEPASAEVTMVPDSMVACGAGSGAKVLRLRRVLLLGDCAICPVP